MFCVSRRGAATPRPPAGPLSTRVDPLGRRIAQIAAVHAGVLLAGLRLAAIFVRPLLQEDVPVHRVPRASRHRPLFVAAGLRAAEAGSSSQSISFGESAELKNYGMIIQTALYDPLVFREGGGRALTRAIF
jgi:hypothetical protein